MSYSFKIFRQLRSTLPLPLPVREGSGVVRKFAFAIIVLVLGGMDDAVLADEPKLAPPPVKTERSIYQPQGAPADPKVPAQWNKYRDHAAATKLLQALAKTHADRCKLQSLGKSYGGRDMWVLTITNFAQGKEAEKPAMWIDGGIHANEIQGVEVPLYTAWYLLEMYGRSPFITRLVNERVFYVMPTMSPDSRDAHMHEPNSTHSPRSGQRPVDDDMDGLVDEDKPDDLDGDGHITQMRVKDPNGKHKPHKDFANLMVPVEPGEKGSYTLLGQEGYDNDGDGKVNEDGDGYYDPNRDWAWNWQPQHIQGGAYRYPFSIPENRLVADFIMAHPNIAGAQSFHNTGGMLLRGPGAKEDHFGGEDEAVYAAIGKKGELMLPGYRSINIGKELYEVYGGEVDWLHAMQGVFSFTNELFTPFNFFRRSTDRAWMAKQEEAELFNKWLLFEDGFVSWHEVDHPQFGKIEVGGFKKNWIRQPPSFLLEEECHRNMAFTLYHADQMPQAKVQSITAKALAGGIIEVTATIVNDKLIPTHAALDVKHKITPSDLVTLTGEKLQVHAGLIAADQFFTEEVREQKRNPAELKVPKIDSQGVVYCRWLVTGTGPYTVTVKSPKGGVDSLKK